MKNSMHSKINNLLHKFRQKGKISNISIDVNV